MGDVVVKGVPMPPPEVIFMNRTAEEGLKRGKAQVKWLGEAGVPVGDGLLIDIGCGYGRLAYGLLASDFSGSYAGIDIVKHRIDWLRQNFSPRMPNYQFHCVDVQNDLYNPNGANSAADYSGILQVEHVETIVLLSVFTHMYEHDIREHLAKIVRLMNSDSVLAFTCFLYDGPAQGGIKAGHALLTFPHEIAPNTRIENPNIPLAAIAYTEKAFDQMLGEVGLSGRITRGTWSEARGERNKDERQSRFGQDLVVARITT